MQKHIILTKSLSRFLQLLDGNFPSGMFVHSFGLEPHIIEEKVVDIETLQNFLFNYILNQYQKNEFVLIKNIYQCLDEKKIFLIKKYEKRFLAMQTFEYVKAYQTIGENYAMHLSKLAIQKEICKEYFEITFLEKSFLEVAILAVYAYELDIDLQTFLVMWTKKNCITIALTAQKISKIKPSKIQQMLFEFDEKIEDIVVEKRKYMENFNPIFEEQIGKHKYLEPKLFVT